jgi:hypothetical protein
MSIKTSTPGLAARRSHARHGLRTPAPDTLVWCLLLVLAMIVAALSGLALGNL